MKPSVGIVFGSDFSTATMQLPDGQDVVITVEPSDDADLTGILTSDIPSIDLIDAGQDSGVIHSSVSNTVPYSTLFDDFELSATPFYNFFVKDETINDDEPKGNRHIEDLPRYVRLSWNVAPRTSDLSIKSDQTAIATKSVRTDSFIVRDAGTSDITRNGTTFSSMKLDFRSAVNSVSNGYVSPGVVVATVEIPKSSRDGFIQSQTQKIDESTFLVSTETDGLSIHELQDALNVTSGEQENMIESLQTTTSKLSDEEKRILFEDRYLMKRDVVGSDLLNLQSVVASSPMMSLEIATVTEADRQSTDVGDRTYDELKDVLSVVVPERIDESEKLLFTEVNFADLNIGGVVSEKKISFVSKPEHVENVSTIGSFLPEMAALDFVQSNINKTKTLPSFPAASEEEGTEYIGYVIEKYVMGKSGVFSLVEEILVSDVSIEEFIDSKVVYGGVYRYRIKTILKWVRPAGVMGDGTEIAYIGNDSLFDNSTKLSTHACSFFQSEWNRKWRYAAIIDTMDPPHPDEFIVRPISIDRSVSISWKLPYNPQRDIDHYRLFRKTMDQSGNDLSQWEIIHIVVGAKNVSFIDRDVGYFQENGGLSYVYAAQTISKHRETSKLSTQIATRLNKDYKNSGEYPCMHVSCAGAALGDRGSFSVRPIRRTFSEIVIRDSVVVTGRASTSKIAKDDVTYCLRFKSLDTGETVDVKMEVDYQNLPHRMVVHKESVVVPIDADVIHEMPARDNVSITIGEVGTGVTVKA